MIACMQGHCYNSIFSLSLLTYLSFTCETPTTTTTPAYHTLTMTNY
ncbi:hypothetical protein CSUI_005863 [Cystoisospora suis]|uniref:Uncharacterized protein n=1 Tax=Cystoisospora suis TaxID=483139 RepID=A0A2C6KW33_9APIC|nr:hypothetical protein CSUI_005863 [Cystoisospora suis]